MDKSQDNPPTGPLDTPVPDGVWRPLLRTRLVGRAEPVFVDGQGVRSAASLWSGAVAWAQLLRHQPVDTPVVVWRTARLPLLQLLVAVLWEGRALRIEPPGGPWPAAAWCVDGRQVGLNGQVAARLGDGGWPDLDGPAQLTTLAMVNSRPAPGCLTVRGQRVAHGELWRSLGAALVSPVAEPATAVLPAFDLAGLATPSEVLQDTLVPLLRCTEVWEQAALSPR